MPKAKKKSDGAQQVRRKKNFSSTEVEVLLTRRKSYCSPGENRFYSVVLSEFDQRLRAIIGETALSGVPSAECLDTDLGPEATLSPPPCASSAPEDSEVWPHHWVRTHILTGLWLRGERDTMLHSDVVQDTAGHDYPTDL
ncbi:hypothetical protein D4764_03G0013300 [Takifugu flavidus]|uniref:Uncharacterized protein n=1 Tax=Takifugu flavidus TaxID=433684 RepID=A0A5C6NA09_9TELE|nr:hypothetical protein D4764_03G0013300 [Takifugu flavidus]